MKTRMLAALVGLAALAFGGPVHADDSIYDIQLGLISVGTTVTVEDVVVTGVGRFGFFIQEEDADPTWQRQFSGVWVFTNDPPTVQRGDRVNVVGDIEEFFDFTEVNVSDSASGDVTVIGDDGIIPDPVDVAMADVNTTGALAENYEGVLIRVDSSDPTLYAFEADFGEWYLRANSDGSGDSLLVDNYSGLAGGDFIYDIPAPGTELSYAQGVLVYNFSDYKLAPRDCAEDLGAPCPPVLQGAYATSNTGINIEFGVELDPAIMTDEKNYNLASLFVVTGAALDPDNAKIVNLTTEVVPDGIPETVTVLNSRSAEGLDGDPNQTYDFYAGITPIRTIQEVANPAVDDASPLFDQVVTVEGTVTAVEGNYYYIQDDDGGEWDGLYVRVARSGPLEVGDVIQASGRVNEFFGSTQINFQIGVNNYENFGPLLGVGGGLPVVNDVTAAQIPYRDANLTAEPWENNLVRVTGATVDSMGLSAPAFGEWQLLQGALPDTAGFDLFGITQTSYDPCVGDVVDFTGVLRYDFDQYRIAPRVGRGGDIIVTFDNPDCETTSVPGQLSSARFGLTAAPNPFVNTTRIRLQLPSAGKVRVEVMDVAGRLVRTLADHTFEAGQVSLNWDGRNNADRVVPAGTYFYLVRVDDEEVARRMVKLD